VASILYELPKPSIGFDLEWVLIGEQRRGILQYQTECADLQGNSIKHLWAVEYQKQTKNVFGKRPQPTSTPVRDWNATIEFLCRATQSLPAAPIRPLTSSASSADASDEAALRNHGCRTRTGEADQVKRRWELRYEVTEEGMCLEEGVAGGGDGRQEVGSRLLLLLPQQLLRPGCTTDQ
jgi:hypothetical protein